MLRFGLFVGTNRGTKRSRRNSQMKYTIEKREIHTVKVEVEAADPQTALQMVIDGEGAEVEGSSEYSDTIDPLGMGGGNQYQWRVFGPKMDEILGTPAVFILKTED